MSRRLCRNPFSTLKVQVALKSLRDAKTLADIVQKQDLHSTQTHECRKQLLVRPADVFGAGGKPEEPVEVPTIAAVNGPAVGAGFDLTCMCDMRVAADTATFAESFIKVGIVPGDGGACLLPRVVGKSLAAEMSFTGDALNAQEALACGLVSRIVPGLHLMAEAGKLAARVAANPGPTLRMTKRLLREGEHQRLESLLELSAGYQALAHKTWQHREAVEAFIEKRKPMFDGE
jgi:enoyl-CoA hydratase/carnithine racemase